MTKSIPLDLGGDLPKPIRSVVITLMQPIVPYFRPYMRPLNYFEYKKNSDLDACVQVIKATIKANGEMIDEEITN
jgi:hypothetical protein